MSCCVIPCHTRPAPPQSDRPLALPHLSVADIRWVDWGALRAAGFRGCVFDKDNTLTGEAGSVARQVCDTRGSVLAGRQTGRQGSQSCRRLRPHNRHTPIPNPAPPCMAHHHHHPALPAEPYSLELHPHARDSLAACRAAFDGKLVLYSNSAGLQQFDPEGGWAVLCCAACFRGQH